MRSIMFAVLLASGLFAVMLVLLEMGRRTARRAADASAQAAQPGLGAVDGAVFGLLGLLVAFTFAAAESRFNLRRQQIVQEANAIGTAYLRLDLLPSGNRDRLREQFKRYLDARIDTYRLVPDFEAVASAMARSTALQGEIWTEATAGCRPEPVSTCMLLLPALNEMIDITTTRLFATRMHQSPLVFAMLTGVALVSALLAGYGMGGARGRSAWLHMLAYAGVMALTVYVILDLDFPRLGLIRIDAADRVLMELRQSMQ